MLALNVGNAWGAEATVYTSNVELSSTGGTKATASKAKISNVDYSAMKLGSSGNAGNFYVNLPANTTSLTLHAAAWNGKNSNKLTLSSETAGVTISPSTAQTLTANSGVSGNSTTYTITPNNTTEFFTFTLTGATSGAKIKLACTERCLIWGVNAETAASGETPGEGEEPTPDPEEPETPGIDGESSTATFTYTDLKGQGASGTGAYFTGATKENIHMSGKGNGNNSYVQIYANNYLTFTPTNATITKIVLTATSGYIKTWSASEGTIEVSGDKATWTGSSTSTVTLTNTATAQARITQMDVTYTSSSSGSEEPVPSLTAK